MRPQPWIPSDSDRRVLSFSFPSIRSSKQEVTPTHVHGFPSSIRKARSSAHFFHGGLGASKLHLEREVNAASFGRHVCCPIDFSDLEVEQIPLSKALYDPVYIRQDVRQVVVPVWNRSLVHVDLVSMKNRVCRMPACQLLRTGSCPQNISTLIRCKSSV